MSFNVWLEMDTGGPKPAEVAEVGSTTYNLAAMYERALGEPLRDLDGRLAYACLEPVTRAVVRMTERREEFEALNPANGWGDYEGAKAFLIVLLEAICANPKARVAVR